MFFPSLRKKSPYWELLWSAFFTDFPAFGLNTERYCVKSVRIRSYPGPHFSRISQHSDWIWRDTPYLSVFSPNVGKCGKNEDQNNSQYRHFLRNALALPWSRFFSRTIAFDNVLMVEKLDYQSKVQVWYQQMAPWENLGTWWIKVNCFQSHYCSLVTVEHFFFSILYLTTIEIILTIYNFILHSFNNFAIETN